MAFSTHFQVDTHVAYYPCIMLCVANIPQASITAEGKAEWSVDATKLKDKDKEEKEKEDAASQSPRYSSLLLQRQAARQVSL